MSVQAKMTALAEEIRTLSGTTDPLGLDAMAAQVGDANSQVSQQSELIAQIQLALEGKGSSGGALFVSTAEGILPMIYRGTARSEFAPGLESGAQGVLQEG